MKHILPALFAFGFSLQTQAQLQRIVLQGTGAPQVFTDINAAIAAAQAGDKLYLSGGLFTSATDIIIDKELHLIGAGIHPDSTSVTTTTTISTSSGMDLRITTAASNSTFTGLVLDPGQYTYYGTSNADDDPTGLLFQRCRFTERMYSYTESTTNTASATFDECIFNHHIYGGDGGAATFTRCILDYQTQTSSAINSFANLIMDHCVFLNVQAFRNSSGATISNSICTATSYPVYQSNGVTFTNCLFSGTTYTGNSSGEVITNCTLNVPPASIFIDQTDLDYQFTDDMHLTVGSGGIGGADDGTDIGIYGSSSPYKPGAVPLNPHFSAASIAPATDANGDLPVNIRVAAQPN
ncbi:MAG: right-handed parallel beta-helix repeat-containing protein [Flavobacteriales bacterium]|nr:right-handed parallel beta-helix repeat-containing protein [Flavobacteriales bacterium]